MITQKENAELGRRLEELEAKRLKLKLIAKQHRSDEEQSRDLEEAESIKNEIAEIAEKRLKFTPENKKESYKMSDFIEKLSLVNAVEVVETQEYRSG